MTGTALLQSASSSELCGVHARSRLFRPFRKHHSKPRRYSNSRTAHRCKASTEAQTDDRSEIQIEGIEQNYCDDFVCTSSPAVEQNLRALARDVVRTSTWTSDLFADEVRYKVRLSVTKCHNDFRTEAQSTEPVIHTGACLLSSPTRVMAKKLTGTPLS